MRLARNVRLSQKALLRHPIRTLLALSGTAVGVGAVLVMVAIGDGAKREVVEEIERLGRNLLVVSAESAPRLPGRSRSGASTVTTLRERDVEAILEGSLSVARAAPAQDRALRIQYGTLSTMARVLGTTSDYEEIRDFRAVRGRYFTGEEGRAGDRVAVLGSQIKEILFGEGEATGEIIRVGTIPFRVIGVLESKGASVNGAANEDNQIVIPIRTALRRVFNVDYLKMIYVQVRDRDEMDRAEAEIASVLRDQHRLVPLGREDDFAIQNQKVILDAELETVATFRRMIVGLGAVALALGGVGILSIMLLSVRERRNEIGLRTAVGARRRDIRTQFLIEALLLGGVGGLLGILAGVLVAWSVNASAQWRTEVTLSAVVLAVGAALAIGIVFGVYPAQRAARLDPIDALRAE